MIKKPRLLYGLIFFGLLVTEVLIALYVNDSFIRPFFGDVLVTVLLCCFCRILIPRKIPALPVYVFLFATAVEISQYFDLVKLLGKPAQGEFVRWFTDEMELEYQAIDCRDITKGNPAKRVQYCPEIIARTFEKCMEILEERGLV